MMLELQLVTGMRTGDIDRSSEVWFYRPSRHKPQHHGYERVVYLGERAQEIVTPFMKMDPATYLFSPAESEAERRAI